MSNQTFVEAGRFIVVGVINTAIDFAVFFTLVIVFEVEIVPANIISFGAAVVNSFFMNKYWSFRSRNSRLSVALQLPIFIAVNVAGMALSTVTVWWLAAYIPLFFAKCVATAVSFAWNFSVSRRLVYGARLG